MEANVNTLYYLSSTAAQVWAALMVFQILLIRDYKKSIATEIDLIWSEARDWWSDVLWDFYEKNGSKKLVGKLPEFGLTVSDLQTADVSRDAFLKVMKAIHSHSIVIEVGKNLHYRFGTRWIEPSDGQARFNSLVNRLSALVDEEGHIGYHLAYFTGAFAVALNLSFLCFTKELADISDAPRFILGVNILLLFGISYQLNDVLKSRVF